MFWVRSRHGRRGEQPGSHSQVYRRWGKKGLRFFWRNNTVSLRSWTGCKSALCRIELELLLKALCCGKSGLMLEDPGPSPRHPTIWPYTKADSSVSLLSLASVSPLRNDVTPAIPTHGGCETLEASTLLYKCIRVLNFPLQGSPHLVF